MEEKVEKLCKSTSSCLKENKFDSMKSFDWEKILLEMEEHCPAFLDMFMNIAVPSHDSGVKNWQPIMQRVCICYSVAVQSRRPSFSLVQRVLTVLSVEGGMSKKVTRFVI